MPALRSKITKEICRNFKLSRKQYKDIALARGKFAGPVTGRIEREGIPFNLEAANFLSENVGSARDSLIAGYTEAVTNPFYAKDKPTLAWFKGKWVDKYHLFEAYIKDAGLDDTWRRTDKGKLSKDDDDLSEYDGDPNIFFYRQTKKALKAFRKRESVTRLDDESKLGRSPLTKGAGTSSLAIAPPIEWPDEVWRELARQGKLKDVGGGFFQLAK